MAIAQRLYKFGKWEYSFIVSIIALIVATIGIILALFPHSLVRFDDPRILTTIAILALQPVAFVVGYCGAAKNVSNPYSIKEGLPLMPIIGVIGLIGYVATTGALLLGQLDAGFGDSILTLAMIVGFAGFGWRMYKRHWIAFDLEE